MSAASASGAGATGPVAGPPDLKRVFRRHAAAVAVITARYRDAPVGLLVSSLTSVSAEPPLISFNVARTSSSWPALEQTEHLGLHILGADQEELADRFARQGVDRFATPTAWRPGPHDIPLLEGVAARAVAVVEQRIPVAAQVIVVARLLHSDAQDDGAPLVYHDGGYRRLRSTHNGTDIRPPTSRLTVIRGEGDSE